jgi:hypothetical protein
MDSTRPSGLICEISVICAICVRFWKTRFTLFHRSKISRFRHSAFHAPLGSQALVQLARNDRCYRKLSVDPLEVALSLDTELSLLEVV